MGLHPLREYMYDGVKYLSQRTQMAQILHAVTE